MQKTLEFLGNLPIVRQLLKLLDDDATMTVIAFFIFGGLAALIPELGRFQEPIVYGLIIMGGVLGGGEKLSFGVALWLNRFAVPIANVGKAGINFFEKTTGVDIPDNYEDQLYNNMLTYLKNVKGLDLEKLIKQAQESPTTEPKRPPVAP